MADEFDDDLFADVYDDETAAAPPPKVSQPPPEAKKQEASEPIAIQPVSTDEPAASAVEPSQSYDQGYNDGYNGNQGGGQIDAYDGHDDEGDEGMGSIGIKEDGKMFIGGLNWETTDESLRNYFSTFGEVTECTVMRDGATGRSRGFGFLTFRDPKVVNTVMVKEHFLDGKIIDPKRAIPREEQERTAKIFVGGVSPEASEQDFKQFFEQFGRVIDATLMMDKDTGRPRGFGFVTFDGDEAVDRTLAQPLQIYGKPMEVKRAQPRATLQAEEKKFGGRQGREGGFNRDNGGGGGYDQQQGGGQMGGDMGQGGMTPAMMAKYWFNMQQYFKQMQTMMAAGSMGQGMGQNQMGSQMNPAMMAQMMGGMGGAGGQQMNPMMQQMAQQMANQQQGGQNSNNGQGGFSPAQGSNSPSVSEQNQQANYNSGRENQQQRQQPQFQGNFSQGGYNQGAGQAWDGMYEDSTQQNQPPSGPSHAGRGGRGGFARGGARPFNGTPPTGPSNAPVNAPTGPKNAGRPGSNYRGGGRGSGRGFHPYQR